LAPTTVAERLSGNFAATFRALRHRDFRIFIAGYVVSLIGTWMQSLAQAWLVYRLTGSGFMLGLTTFAQHIPVLLLGPVAGVVADRYPRYRILWVANTLFLLQAAALAALTLTGAIRYQQVLMLAAAWGVINAFEIPARQSFYIHMVGKDDLLNAIALNSVVFNAGRIVGPSVGGLIVAAAGEGFCFALNGLTFVAVLGSLAALKIRHDPGERAESPLQHMRDGLAYAWRTRPLRALLAQTATVNISGAPALVLAPLFADGMFQRGSRGLGFLSGMMGVGAVLGTLALARRTGTRGLPGTVFASCLMMAAGLAAFAGAPAFAVSLASVAFIGFNVMRQNASSNTLIQSLIPDAYRGRIMAMYSMTVVGMLPVGSLLAGMLSDQVGPRATVFAGAILCASAALRFRPAIRSIDTGGAP
jgi:MFS family permease